MNKIQKTLTAAKAIIADPAKWIKGKYAITKADAASMGYGSRVPLNAYHAYGFHPEAVCFCAVGAMQRVVGEEGDIGIPSLYLSEAAKALSSDNYMSAPRFNDAPATTHKDVMAMFDKAIELAGKGL